MRTLGSLSGLKSIKRPVVLAAGFFDGLHRGHARVIDRAIRMARSVTGEAWALTFDTHPLRALGMATPPLLTSNLHKLVLMERMGLDGCVMLRFGKQLAGVKAETFIRMLFESAPTLAGICAGRDWRFGRGAAGDVALLAESAGPRGVEVTAVTSVKDGRLPVSSTRIRECIRHGKFTDAARMLGRPYSFMGVVTRGRGVGRQLGFPTANLAPDNEALPPPGVYAAAAAVESRRCTGLLYCGNRPTFRGRGRQSIELHLLDFEGDLYGRRLEVFVTRRIRGERSFASAELLRAQIARDATRVRKSFQMTAGNPRASLSTRSGNSGFTRSGRASILRADKQRKKGNKDRIRKG
ncbi:MAG: riboflavin biosynthesis protein RibF [Lentisphaerae bacterium]|nr:riboflavin biosynthesis protein RibF [Lentisphaerota bacterium]